MCTSAMAEHEIHFIHRRHGWLSTSPRDRNCACGSAELGTLERRSSEHQCNGKCTIEGIPCTSSIDRSHGKRVHLLTQAIFGSEKRAARTPLEHQPTATLFDQSLDSFENFAAIRVTRLNAAGKFCFVRCKPTQSGKQIWWQRSRGSGIQNERNFHALTHRR